MEFMNFSAFFHARNDLRLFQIKKKKQIKTLFYKSYHLSNFKDDLNSNNESFFIKV